MTDGGVEKYLPGIEGEALSPRSGLDERFLESLKRKYFMYPHFIDGLATGKYEDLPREEVEKIVDEHFFSFESLIQLSAEEENLLREQTVETLSRRLNQDEYRKLSGDVFYTDDDFYGGKLYVDKGLEDQGMVGRRRSSEARLLAPEEKVRLLSDPKHWLRFRLRNGNMEGGLTHWGNRDLVGKDDQYFGATAEFTDLLASLRSKTGVDKLAILDIGCGMGKALQDMKEIDSNLETHGIMQEQEPAMFNADFFHYINAERFPADFRNKFHFINSQIAFRYFSFQNIALRNVLLSLAKGGFARLGFSFEAKDDAEGIKRYLMQLAPGAESNYEAMKVLAGKEIAKLDVLQQAGKVRYETSEHFKACGNQGYLGIEKLSEWDEEDVKLITGA